MAIAQNKRKLRELERRVEILEDELGIDPDDGIIDAGDDGEIVTDGGENRLVADVSLQRDGTYKELGRIAEAIEQLGFEIDDVYRPGSDQPELYVTVSLGNDDGDVATDGGEDLDGQTYPVDEDRLEGDQPDRDAPEVRLREVIKQIGLARRELAHDDLIHPALDEAEVLLRGAADRLEWEGFPDEVVRELSPSEIVDGDFEGWDPSDRERVVWDDVESYQDAREAIDEAAEEA